MKNQEMKKPIPVELDDDVLEKIGGGGARNDPRHQHRRIPLSINTNGFGES